MVKSWFNSVQRGNAMSGVTVSRKGQVVIPATLRRQLGIQPGSQVEVLAVNGRIEIELQHPPRSSSHEAGFGMLKYAGPPRRRLADFDVAQLMRLES
jgi:antitoxin PrlF